MADHGRVPLSSRILAVIVLVLAGCAPPPADPFDKRGPITLIDGPDTSSNRQLARLVEDWNAHRGDDDKVTFVEGPYSTNEYRAQLRARAQDLASGDRFTLQSQCYDVMTMDVIWTAEFAKAGYLVPLDASEFRLDTFLSKPVDAVTLDGRLWAVPQRTDAGLLYYRKDILDAEGLEPPKTWDELIAQASTIGPKYGMQGYVGQFDHYEGLTVNVVEAIWAKGGEVLTRNGTVVVNSPEARAGITMLAHGFEAGWVPRGALAFDEEDSREAFQQGSALFARNWPYVYPNLADPNSPVSGKFAVAALPGPSALGGWNLGVSSCSTHRKTARDFIKFVTSEANQRRLFERGGFAPTVAAVYDDPRLQQDFPYLDLLRRSVQNSRIRPTTPNYEDVSDAIQEYVGQALNNPLSVDAMAEKLAERLVTVMQRR